MSDTTIRRHPREYAMALRYQQRSAEIAALQRQCYLLATLRLEAAIERNGGADGLAIMTDLDETVLNNMALLAREYHLERDFSDWRTWQQWERDGKPALIPGAIEFLELADRLGVTIFYVSDRFEENKAATVATLKELGLPQALPDRVRLYGPPKAERRAVIAEGYTLILQLGDTLHDFDGGFAGVPLDDQHRLASDHASRFGEDWIIFPNAAHGTWIEADLHPWEAPVPEVVTETE